jgi:hypothetical protein
LPHEVDNEADLVDEIHRLEWVGRKELGQKGTAQPFNMFWKLCKIICNNMQGKKERLDEAQEDLEIDFKQYLKHDVCYKPIVKVLQTFWFVSFNSNKKRGGGFFL